LERTNDAAHDACPASAQRRRRSFGDAGVHGGDLFARASSGRLSERAMTIETGTEELSPDAARVYRAARAINAMSDDMDAELFQPNPVLDALRLFARKAPLRSLAVAFVLGAMFARRR
jgi:hypothetical protein